MTMTPVSCYCMASFNYGGKNTRDVQLNCKFHLSNIIADIIFDSMEWGITIFLHVGQPLSSQHQRDRFSCLIIIKQMDLLKP